MTVAYDEALALARACWDEVDYFTEYEEAYVFSKYGDMSIGGMSPVAVLKDTGECIDFVSFINEFGGGEVLAEGKIA